jgi:hypothetical protein
MNSFLKKKLKPPLLTIFKIFTGIWKRICLCSQTTTYFYRYFRFYIDLVFYNYILKCFVIIDLKTGELSHQDIGQIDMYVRMYDDLKRGEGDNPTIGILLCSEKDETIVKYSVLNDKNNLFASKYLLYLPKEEELNKLSTRTEFALNWIRIIKTLN